MNLNIVFIAGLFIEKYKELNELKDFLSNCFVFVFLCNANQTQIKLIFLLSWVNLCYRISKYVHNLGIDLYIFVYIKSYEHIEGS